MRTRLFGKIYESPDLRLLMGKANTAVDAWIASMAWDAALPWLKTHAAAAPRSALARLAR